MSEYPIAEEELKTMTKRFWAQVEVTEKTIKERDQYREALDRIARPIWWMQEDAKHTGHTLNGAMAASLADSGSYLRGIAEKALSQENAELRDRPESATPPHNQPS
jgi:hypothetical protein